MLPLGVLEEGSGRIASYRLGEEDEGIYCSELEKSLTEKTRTRILRSVIVEETLEAQDGDSRS